MSNDPEQAKDNVILSPDTLSISSRSTNVQQREAIEWSDLETRFGKKPLTHKDSTMLRVTDTAGSFCMKSPIITWILSLFPCIEWLRNYSIKNDFLCDLIAGLTVSVIHIPQGMAYGLLAGSGPASGLYVSFFPVVIYSLMSTSRHVSLGTMAVTSIMVSSVITRFGSMDAGTIGNSTLLDSGDPSWPPSIEELTTTLCLTCGIIMLIAGILQLGVVSLILSDQMVTAFTCGAVVHIATAQINGVFGVTVPSHEGGLKLLYTWKDLLWEIPSANLVCLGISAVTMFSLLAVKELIDPWLKSRYKSTISIPIELLVLIVVTLVTWYFKLNEKFSVPIIGSIPAGLPEIKTPRMDFAVQLLPDCIAIVLVTYTVTLSVGLLYGKKYKYVVDPNQELLAIGTANILASFAGCYPATGGISRSALLEKAEVKTLLSSIISSGVLLIIILYVSQLFFFLPKCVLSSIILVCLKSMFMQSANLKKVWNISRLEGISWLVTFLGVVAIDVDYGIIIGVACSFLIVLIQFILPNAYLMGQLPSTEIYVDVKQFSRAQEIPGLKIFRFSSALFFLNRNNFRDNLFQLCLGAQYADIMKSLAGKHPKGKLNNVSSIVIDCSTISFVDSSGVEVILEVVNILKDLGIRCYLASCTASLMAMFERTSFRDNLPKDYSSIFPTVHDAVIYYFKHFSPTSLYSEIISSPVQY